MEKASDAEEAPHGLFTTLGDIKYETVNREV